MLDTGEIDLVIMICCSNEFIESNGASDQVILDFTVHALTQNLDTRIGLALPWVDFPQNSANAIEYRRVTDTFYLMWLALASNLRADFVGVEVFTIYYGGVYL